MTRNFRVLQYDTISLDIDNDIAVVPGIIINEDSSLYQPLIIKEVYQKGYVYAMRVSDYEIIDLLPKDYLIFKNQEEMRHRLLTVHPSLALQYSKMSWIWDTEPWKNQKRE